MVYENARFVHYNIKVICQVETKVYPNEKIFQMIQSDFIEGMSKGKGYEEKSERRNRCFRENCEIFHC